MHCNRAAARRNEANVFRLAPGNDVSSHDGTMARPGFNDPTVDVQCNPVAYELMPTKLFIDGARGWKKFA